jgi:LCP family protein required for cell wall assembly
MPNGGPRDEDPQYDWLYERDDAAGQQPDDPSSNDATQMMPLRRDRRSGHRRSGLYAEPSDSTRPLTEDYGYAQQPQQPQQPYPAEPQYPPPLPPRPSQPQPRPRGPQGPPGRPPSTRRRRRLPIIRIILLLIFAYLVFLVAMPVVAWNRVDKVPFESAEGPADSSGVTYLLVGSDSREGLTREEQNELGTGRTGGKRTDTIMLLHVPTFGPPILVSIPRDLRVEIPGRDGRSRINAAYAFGGAELLTRTVENLANLRVDEYVEIGFGGFASIVNALDGIEMCLPAPMKDKDAHIDLQAGCQTLDGKNALGYVRARKSDPRGDLGRVERQRQFLAAVLKKAASPATFVNPFRYATLNTAGGDALTVGDSTGLFDLARFALAMRAISGDGGVTLTVPVTNSSAERLDEDKAKLLFDAMRTGSAVPRDLLPSPSPS